MNYLAAFNDFDPKTGECPQLFNDQFNLIAERARTFLKNRSIDEINEDLKEINRIINSSRLDSIDSWIKKIGDQDMMIFETPVILLKYHMNNYDNPDPTICIDETAWPKYFAILALARIGQATSVEKVKYSNLGFTEQDIKNRNLDLIAEYLADAEEAMDFADSIIEFNEIKKATKKETADNARKEIAKKQSESDREAENQRFLEHTRIKNGFIPHWEKGNFESKKQAAGTYYENLSKENKKILCPSLISENAVRTLLTHLRRHERQKDLLSDISLE